MLSRNSDQEWEKFGKDDPYFGVISMDKFRRDKLDDDAKKEFFESGREHIKYIIDTICNDVSEGFTPGKALDFGCGVGRCTLPLAEVAEQVTGVDVSDSMLAEACRNAETFGINNVDWVNPGPDLSTLSGKYDLIHTFIVFQHIPPARGYKIIQQMIDLLEDGGVASLQMLYYRDVPASVPFLGWLRKYVPGLHGLVNLMHGKPFSEPLMEKNRYDLNQVMFMLHQSGCGSIRVHLQGKGKLKNAVIFFRKKEDSIPYDSFYEAL
jgi:SAM-dependent methyltransferase